MSTFRAALRDVLPEIKSTVERGDAAVVPQESLLGDHELIRRAMAALPNTSELFPSREDFIEIAYALRAAFGPAAIDEAQDAFQEWAGRWADGDNDPEYTDAEFGRCKGPYRRGASWLFELAEKHGGGAFTRAALWFEQPAESELFPPGSETVTARFVLVSAVEAVATALTTSAKPLVKGLLDQGAFCVLYGASGEGKSFLLMDIFYCIAIGLPWGGMKVAQGRVVYLVAEGSQGARRRVLALHRKYGPATNFYLIESGVNLFNAEVDLQPLIAVLSPLGPIALAIDTLARAIAGGDENSTKDMSIFVRNVDTLRSALKCFVALVHHTGKDLSKGARGSSALRAATDTEIEIADGRITATKQRDMEGGFSVSFTRKKVELGRDDDGDPITSATIDLVADPSSPIRRPKGYAALRVLEAIEAMDAENPRCRVRPDDVASVLSMDGKKSKSSAVRFQMQELTKTGFLKKPEEGRWSLHKPASYFEPWADILSNPLFQ